MTRSVLKNGRKTTRIINLYLCFDSVDLGNNLITKNIDYLDQPYEGNIFKFDTRMLPKFVNVFKSNWYSCEMLFVVMLLQCESKLDGERTIILVVFKRFENVFCIHFKENNIIK